MPHSKFFTEENRYPVTVYQVGALEVTAETAQEVARWCGGEVSTDIDPESKAIRFCGVMVAAVDGSAKALEGDFVVKWPSGEFSKMTPTEFASLFEPAKTY